MKTAHNIAFAIPQINGLSDVYFLRLELKDAINKTKSINWYWLSEKRDALNWKKSKWFYTPQSAYADFSALQNMPSTTINVDIQRAKKNRKLRIQSLLQTREKQLHFLFMYVY